MSSSTLSFRQYVIYFLVGSFVGVLAVIARELFALITGDAPVWFFLSVIVVYLLGILLSFFLHNKITFGAGKLIPIRRTYGRHFRNFVFIAVLSAVLVGLLSSALRYQLGFDSMFGVYSAAMAFIVSSLLISVASYYLNARFVFHSIGR